LDALVDKGYHHHQLNHSEKNIMEQILEIRDGCNTPGQLLRSLAFSRFLKSYKQAFIKDLMNRTDDQKQEAEHKIEFIKRVRTRDLITILEANGYENPKEAENCQGTDTLYGWRFSPLSWLWLFSSGASAK